MYISEMKAAWYLLKRGGGYLLKRGGGVKAMQFSCTLSLSMRDTLV
jgi:hypothetical protein